MIDLDLVLLVLHGKLGEDARCRACWNWPAFPTRAAMSRPPPSGALLPTLNTLFTVLFRGNSAVADRDPTFKDAAMLTQFSRAG